MEPFLQLPGLTIQKIAKEQPSEEEEETAPVPPVAEEEAAAPESPKPAAPEEEDEEEEDEDEASAEEGESSEKEDEESDIEDGAETENSEELGEEEDDVEDEEEEEPAEEAKDKPVEGEGVKVVNEANENGGEVKEEKVDEEEKAEAPKTEHSPTKRKKRKKNDPEKDCVKKKRRKRRAKEQKNEDGSDSDEDGDDGDPTKKKRKKVKNLRKNIREVMKDDELDEETKAAQREEMERLRRVQEQQKMLKEMQRKIMMEKQRNLFQTLGHSPSVYRNCTITPVTSNADLPSYPDAKFSEVGRTPGGASVSLVGKTEPEEGEIFNSEPTVAEGSARPSSRPAEPKELVTISSSDDDCMIVSGGSDAESEPEDPTNSGLHTNDVFNIPDEQGRVLINVGHPENEPDIFLPPQIARDIKAHQIGGIRFLYDNVVESLERFKTSTGFGCILAHSMGLGKTLQVVSFCDIFLRNTNARHILCIMPINTLQNWLAEFNMWLPAESAVNGNAEPGLEVRPRHFGLHLLNDSQKTLTARAKVIRQWKHDGGVLLIGYELYRLLSLRRDKHSKKKKFVNLVDVEEDDGRKKLLWTEIHDALVKPGPDLVICDEGHRIKNSHASISHALKSMQTKRRVVLTGYPLQNNLLEYWCMVDFVRPNYLGTKTEFCNMFERPIQNGQCVDSTPNDTKLMRYRAHVLHSLLNGFVQRRSHEVLQNALPQKNEYVLQFRMTPLQRKLYSCFMNEVVRTKAVPNPLKAFAVCCKIWNHPDVLYYFLKKRMEGEDLDIEDPAIANPAGPNGPATPPKAAKSRSKKSSKPSALASEEPNAISAVQPKDGKDSVALPSFQSQSSSYNQNFGYGEPSSQFGQQYQQPDFFSGYQQQYPNQPGSQFNLAPPAQNFVQQQGWPLNCYDSQSYSGSNYNDPFGLLPTTLEQKSSSTGKNDRLMEIMDRKIENKEIESIEKMIDEKIESKRDEEIKGLLESGSNMPKPGRGDETSIPYDWATDILKGYEPGKIENSAKMVALFCILEESLKIRDRILLFSQSLFTLNLIEDFLHQNTVPGSDVKWAKNTNYFRLDGSTAAIEREKLINEFNSNPKFHLFLVSTRAGSLGINLVGANRVIVFDASWNPCHDTQAVCRVYRYGQTKQCFVYRFVMDNCLEKKIYDRQINKQGMSDRVVDELNPDAHLSIKEVSNLLYDSEPEKEAEDLSDQASKYKDLIMQALITKHSMQFTKLPFQHESLLKDRKDKKLSQAEKRLAKRSYELEKQAASRPGFNNYYGGYQGSYSTSGGGIINAPAAPTVPIRHGTRPVASVRPMQAPPRPQQTVNRTRWIPAETWQRQGMTVSEMTLPLDVVIPTNSPDRSISLKSGQRVMVLKSQKGVYMQLDNGKIIAIRSAQKSSEPGRQADLPTKSPQQATSTPEAIKSLLPPNSELTITPRAGAEATQLRPVHWPEADPNSSSSNSSSSMNHYAPADVPFPDVLSSLHDVLGQTHPTQPRGFPKTQPPSGSSSSVPLPPSNPRKPIKVKENLGFPFQGSASYPPVTSSEQPLISQTSSLRTSGGGIIASNVAEQPASSGAYQQQQHFPGFAQTHFPDGYSAFHRPEFPLHATGLPDQQQQYAQHGYGSANPYYGHDAYHQAGNPYHMDNYAYQQQQNYDPYNAPHQNNHQFSQPPQ